MNAPMIKTITLTVDDLETLLLFTDETPKIKYTGNIEDHKDQAIKVFKNNALMVRLKVENLLREAA